VVVRLGGGGGGGEGGHGNSSWPYSSQQQADVQMCNDDIYVNLPLIMSYLLSGDSINVLHGLFKDQCYVIYVI
jgi:hypothetical protein